MKYIPLFLLLSGCASNPYNRCLEPKEYVHMYETLEGYCSRMNMQLRDQLQKCEFPKAYTYERCLNRIDWPSQITEEAAKIVAEGCMKEANQ